VSSVARLCEKRLQRTAGDGRVHSPTDRVVDATDLHSAGKINSLILTFQISHDCALSDLLLFRVWLLVRVCPQIGLR